jgi:hypothetical protein
LREARAAGIDFIRVSPARTALDACARNGLKGWAAVGAVKEPDKPDRSEEVRKAVTALRDHPALFFWETVDEPTFVWQKPGEIRVPARDIVATYRLLKQLDPARPVYLNHSPTNLEKTLAEYNAGTDIVATDIYPVIPRGIRSAYALWPDGQQGDLTNETISQTGEYTRKMRRVAGREKRVYMVLQAFAWENTRQKGRDAAKVLYPSFEQTRFMAYQAIVNGAEGLIWWGLSTNPPGSPMWGTLSKVTRELAGMKDALGAASAELPLSLEYHDTGHSLDRGIEWAAREWGGETLVIAVNADKNAVDCTFTLSGYLPGVWREKVEPYGVRIFRCKRGGA